MKQPNYKGLFKYLQLLLDTHKDDFLAGQDAILRVTLPCINKQMEKELKVVLIGIVQGVNLRRSLSKFANILGLRGYVKNEKDGTVVVVAQGSEKKLEELLDWILKLPFPVKVTGMNYEWRTPHKKLSGFKIEKEKSFLQDEAQSFINLTKEIVRLKAERRVPQHVVIIPDGNRRWARQQGLKAWIGHKVSSQPERLKQYFLECRDFGVKYFTFWALSTENLTTRDERELKVLYQIIRDNINEYEKLLETEKIRFRHLGRKDRLPTDIIEALNRLEKTTEKFDDLHMQLCLDYGGRDDIVRAIKKMIDAGITEVNENLVSEYLDGAGIPDPDLIIRTSGEHRTSGILPYQSTYAELYFTNIYFPDFGPLEFRRAILDYAGRVRRFGGTAEEDIKQPEASVSEQKSQAALS